MRGFLIGIGIAVALWAVAGHRAVVLARGRLDRITESSVAGPLEDAIVASIGAPPAAQADGSERDVRALGGDSGHA
jgi:hypothetical protein